MRARFIEAVSRRVYWAGVAMITLVLVGLSIWGEMYDLAVEEGGGGGPAIENPDPVMRMMYTPIGVAVILLVLQFLAANVLFWVGAWGWWKLREAGG
ncbi:MAG: hypothetical protein WD534_10470 [Phycisphaeraceae bacterium]